MPQVISDRRPAHVTTDAVSTGIAGLDDVLAGGLSRNRVHLLEGDTGSGKTTLALQFLLAGVAQRETCLYVALSETGDELRTAAQSHGWTLNGIHVYELTLSQGVLKPEEQYTLFHPSDVELSDAMMAVVEQVSQLNPSRVVIDSLAEMRLLAADPVRYGRQLLALKQFFVGRRSTVLLVDDRSPQLSDLQVQSLSHGVLRLEQRVADYGAARRLLQVIKLHGVKFKGGYHDFRIETGGLRVFPRMVGTGHRARPKVVPVPSGLAELDDLVGGGLDTGTTTAVIGPAGVGKTVLATHYATAMARHGQNGAICLFDERLNTFVHRADRLGACLSSLMADRRITVEQLDPAQVTPGEFAASIRRRVDDEKARFVMIDSLTGYLSAMPDAGAGLVQLHELLTFLNERGVVTIMMIAQHGVLGTGIASPVDVSYLADTLILLRFFEAGGAVRQAISVVKKRTGDHEHTIREFQITGSGPRVGAPLANFRGVMTGVPQYTGTIERLLSETHGQRAARRRTGRARTRSRARG